MEFAPCFMDTLKAYAESHYSNQTFEAGVLKYQDYCPPMTKESLLYRDIISRHFSGNAKWTTDYWMPNREWEGCDVTDPSARVLANYGDSGK